jgi:hypothetical protein
MWEPTEPEAEEADMSDDLHVSDPEGVIRFCAELIEAAGELPERAEDFAHSVTEKTESIAEWVDAESRVTEGQIEALRNMLAGVDRWLDR